MQERDFDRFDAELAAELSALYSLIHKYDFPRLARLRWSDFVTIPEQYSANDEQLKDKYHVEAAEDRELFLNSIEVFNYCGVPFYVVSDDGVCLAWDDPFEIGLWHHDFQGFLSFLVWLSAAASGHTPLAEVQDVFSEEFEIFEGEIFLDNAIEAAQEHLAVPSKVIQTGIIAKGSSFLFTGKLESMTRSEAQKQVLKIGGSNAKSVTKTLDILVIGDQGSPLYGDGKKASKHKKADALITNGASLTIISETDFLKL